MKKILSFLVSLLVTCLVAFGLASAAGACWTLFYQPEMPQKPQKQ